MQNKKNTLLAFALNKHFELCNIQDILDDIEFIWGLKPNDFEGDFDGSSMYINNYNVLMGLISTELPFDEITSAFNYTYDIKIKDVNYFKHKSHLLISLIGNRNLIIDRLLIFSKIIISIFRKADVFSLYFGEISKVFEKSQILNFEKIILAGKLPLDMWINFVVIHFPETTTVFTKGLDNIIGSEFEIIESKTDLDKIYSVLYDSIHTVLLNNIKLRNGEYFKYSDSEKYKILRSKGVYYENQTFKIEI